MELVLVLLLGRLAFVASSSSASCSSTCSGCVVGLPWTVGRPSGFLKGNYCESHKLRRKGKRATFRRQFFPLKPPPIIFLPSRLDRSKFPCLLTHQIESNQIKQSGTSIPSEAMMLFPLFQISPCFRKNFLFPKKIRR